MTDQSIWYLENIDVTGIFCPKKIGSDDMNHDEKVFKKGDFIFLPDQQADKLFFLTNGRVKIGTYGDNGKEITKAILSKGEVFGELSLIGAEKRRDYAYAMDDTTVCAIEVSEMKKSAQGSQWPQYVLNEDYGVAGLRNGTKD